MPYQRLENHTDGGGNFTGITLHGVSANDGTGQVTVMYDEIPGQPGGVGWLNKFPVAFQDKLDERIKLNDPVLEVDEWGPSGEDPNREDAFWEGGDLVTRSVVIVEAFWNSAISKASISVRRASNVVGSGP